MPTISAMMVMTTRSSTSVKPRWSRAALRRMGSPDDLTDREERGHYRYDQSADHDTDCDDRCRPCDAGDPIKAPLQFRLVEFRDAPRQHRQLTRLLAQP